MANEYDDLEAIKAIVGALEPFERSDQERIVRWALEKIGLNISQSSSQVTGGQPALSSPLVTDNYTPTHLPSSSGGSDIKSFVSEKNPTSDNQFAATVAYYYEFEAPPELRKESVSAADLQEACRQVGRSRLGDPGKTLRNAHGGGLLDKAGDRGSYKINTVGENLVAVTLPSGSGTASITTKKKRRITKKSVTKKKSK
ncbi:MAG: hypothetical protein OEY89_16015 [Gammaproteobacteria bacterium]|nr:hypothetical protein [Gammaproteobacteria bacterium]